MGVIYYSYTITVISPSLPSSPRMAKTWGESNELFKNALLNVHYMTGAHVKETPDEDTVIFDDGTKVHRFLSGSDQPLSLA